jgi:hypothetical protein
MVGTDTFTPERWLYVGEHASAARTWLSNLPRDVAEKIAYRNAETLLTISFHPRRAHSDHSAGRHVIRDAGVPVRAPALVCVFALRWHRCMPTGVALAQACELPPEARQSPMRTPVPASRTGSSPRRCRPTAFQPGDRYVRHPGQRDARRRCADAGAPARNELQAVVTRIGPARWRADGLLLHMPGRWEFRFDLRAGERVERFAHAVVVRDDTPGLRPPRRIERAGCAFAFARRSGVATLFVALVFVATVRMCRGGSSARLTDASAARSSRTGRGLRARSRSVEPRFR